MSIGSIKKSNKVLSIVIVLLIVLLNYLYTTNSIIINKIMLDIIIIMP